MKQKEFMETILAYATVALALVTVGLAVATFRGEANHENPPIGKIGVQTWLDFQKRFDSPEMVQARKKLASQLENYDPKKKFPRISETVLNFFEDLGTTYKGDTWTKNSLNLHSVFTLAVGGKQRSLTLIRSEGVTVQTAPLFEDFEYVAKQMHQPDEKIDDKELHDFLEDERGLVSD